MKTPHNEYWTERPKGSDDYSLPDSINVVFGSHNVRQEKCLSPKYEDADAPSESVEGNSWFEKVDIVPLSMPPVDQQPVEQMVVSWESNQKHIDEREIPAL